MASRGEQVAQFKDGQAIDLDARQLHAREVTGAELD
jgi:hypothetical protein